MELDVFSMLHEELLVLIFARIPFLFVGPYRTVWKRWNSVISSARTLFQLNAATVPSTPAFLVYSQLHGINSRNDKLFFVEATPNFRTQIISMGFLGTDSSKVVASCNGLLCYSRGQLASTLFYICNPATRVWKRLPPHSLPGWSFIGLAFDPSIRRCNLVLGIRTKKRNNATVEIYDSATNAWTSSLDVNLPAWPHMEEGVFCKGKLYWLSRGHDIRSRDLIFDGIVAFDVASQRWDAINNPVSENVWRSTCWLWIWEPIWHLTGQDGTVVLVNKSDRCLWKLERDGESHAWSKSQALPRCLEDCLTMKIAVNSSGWILGVVPNTKMVLFDAEGRVVWNFEGEQLNIFGKGAQITVRALDVNNIWWPVES